MTDHGSQMAKGAVITEQVVGHPNRTSLPLYPSTREKSSLFTIAPLSPSDAPLVFPYERLLLAPEAALE